MKARPGEAVYANYNYEAVTVLTTTAEVLDLNGQYRLREGRKFYAMLNGKFCFPSGKKCVQDQDKDGTLDKAGRDPETGKKVDIPYEKGEVHFDASSEGFRSELVYQGAAQGVLRLSYREFVNDMARPAFSQVITYELETSGSTTIAFQGLTLEILEAGNTGVHYRIVEGSLE